MRHANPIQETTAPTVSRPAEVFRENEELKGRTSRQRHPPKLAEHLAMFGFCKAKLQWHWTLSLAVILRRKALRIPEGKPLCQAPPQALDIVLFLEFQWVPPSRREIPIDLHGVFRAVFDASAKGRHGASAHPPPPRGFAHSCRLFFHFDGLPQPFVKTHARF